MSPTTVAELLQQTANRVPSRPAIVAPNGNQQTYVELLGSGRKIGNALLREGLSKGARVAAWMDDSLEYVQLYVACALAGLVIVPINARFTHHEAEQLVADSGAQLLVFTPGLSESVARLDGTIQDLVLVPTSARGPSQLSLAKMAEFGSNDAMPPPSPEDLYIIGYTSGTTGRPKGAMLTQGSVATLARMNAVSLRLIQGSVGALTGSMSFVAVVPAHIISHFYVGGTAHLLGRCDVESLLDTIERFRVTFTYLPSPCLAEFAQRAAADPRRWASLQSVLHSGSKASATKLRELANVIGNRLIEGWGMTENSGGLVTVTTPGDVELRSGEEDRLATVGCAVQEMHVRVIDPEGNDVPNDSESIGELIVSSPALMAGYWNRPDDTTAVLRDGWYHSGDLGSIDEHGYIYISERRVDLIVSGGMNVYPSEVEECILRVPGVVSCAVVGLAHERWGQTVAAAVVVDPATEVTEEQIIDICRQHLASFKKPTRIEFLDALPMTASMKVSRRLVRDLLAAK